MKDLIGTVEAALLIVLALALIFLFQGDPDLWDLLHAKAIAAAKS